MERVEKSLVCSHPNCSTTSAEARLIVPHFDSPGNIKLVLGITEDNLLELVLCPRHYTEVHKQLMYPQPCASCGLKPKKGTRFVRYCPDTTAINQTLYENTGSTLRIRLNGYLVNCWYTCTSISTTNVFTRGSALYYLGKVGMLW